MTREEGDDSNCCNLFKSACVRERCIGMADRLSERALISSNIGDGVRQNFMWDHKILLGLVKNRWLCIACCDRQRKVSRKGSNVQESILHELAVGVDGCAVTC